MTVVKVGQRQLGQLLLRESGHRSRKRSNAWRFCVFLMGCGRHLFVG
jgi:hypothetical protein